MAYKGKMGRETYKATKPKKKPKPKKSSKKKY